MSALEAANAVLEAAGTPLPYREIAERAISGGHWESDGKTPDATLNARLAVDIKKRGAESRFQRVRPGVYALRRWGLPEYVPKARAGGGRTAGKGAKSKTTLSFTDAAARVLAEHGGRRPMHYRAITEVVLAEGLVETNGRTPEATLYAQVLTEIKRKTQRGETPRFVKHGGGYVGLREWLGRGLGFQIERHNADVRKKLLGRLRKVDPADFEALIGRLLVALGFEDVVVTRTTNDGGIDVRGTLVVGEAVRTQMAVQVKRWKRNVRAPVVQQVRGSLGAHEQGLIITTSGFSSGAVREADRADATPVGLMDGDRLVALLVENDIGVTRTTYSLLELGDFGLDGAADDAAVGGG